MKASELTGMSDEQLGITLRDTEKHLFQLRFQSATDRLETPSEIRKARKDIARIQTEKRVRELKALTAQPDDQLAAALAAAESGEATLGRRKPRRLANRLTAIQTRRAAVTKAPAAKGK